MLCLNFNVFKSFIIDYTRRKVHIPVDVGLSWLFVTFLAGFFLVNFFKIFRYDLKCSTEVFYEEKWITAQCVFQSSNDRLGQL